MDTQTAAHLDLADANRDLAASLVRGQPSLDVCRWTAVIAFYAAVHYVNAYLWERQRYEPLNHGERTRKVRDTPPLKRAAFAYRRLSQVAYDMRYEPFAQPSLAVARNAVRDMRDVERVVRAALPPGQPAAPPAPTT